MIQQYIQDRMDEAGPRIALAFQEQLQIEAPVDTSRLRGSIKVKYVKGVLIISAVDYIIYVVFGTKPHVIRPKNKKALAFEVGKKERLGRKEGPGKANIVITKKVMHPGTRPNPFVQDVIFRKLIGIIIQELNR